MDHRMTEESSQNLSNFKHKNVLTGLHGSITWCPELAQTVGSFETSVASKTPEKTNELIRINSEEDDVKFLDKFRSIEELFNSLTCSLRLLTLCKKLPTFQRISTQVEVFSKRKFLYGHLAQIKYILPEAVHMTKILVHDKQTLCMKPDMKIDLVFDVVEGHNEHSDYIALQQVFASRLKNFFTSHPEACAIPEAIFPEPFNRTTQTSFWDKESDNTGSVLPEPICQNCQTIVPEQSPGESSAQSLVPDLFSESSLMYPSFSRHFSKKVVAETVNTQLLPRPVPLFTTSSDSCDAQDITRSQLQDFPGLSSKYGLMADKDIKSEQPKERAAAASLKSTINSISPSACESPRLASSGDSLIIETPVQLTPKRSMPSCDDNLKTTSGHNLSASDKPAKRSLNFSKLEYDVSSTESMAERPELDKVTRDNSVRSLEIQRVERSLSFPAEDCEMHRSDILMHQQMSDCLPDIVVLIHHIFQNASHSSITKEELVHKIIINNIDIVERGEVEEQIELLEKLVPDWIFQKLVPSGDILYSIKKALDLESVQSRLKMSNKTGSEGRL